MSDGNTAELWVPTGSVTVRVPGKVNLYLAVGDRRDDGYHELTTVFHAVSLIDEVTVRNADVLSLEHVGEGAGKLPTDEAVRAVAAEASRACEPGSDIHATAEYRRHLVTVLVERVLRQALATARKH